MQSLVDRLRAGEIIVGDGALGTMLMARGLKAGEPPEAFNLAHPEIVEAIGREYVDAGAEIVTTNTFGGSPARLRQYGLEPQLEAINTAAVEAARRAAGTRAYVSGSVGPTGHLLKPYGDADPSDVAAGYERQVRALASAGVDVLCIETMTDGEEAVLAVRSARLCAPGVPIVATMTFEKTRRGFFTVMGTSIERAARRLADAGADIIGSNCGNGIETMVEVARAFRTHTSMPLAIQSNAGLPVQRDGVLVYPEDPEFMAKQAIALVRLGVGIIGGCCGTTPAHIRALRERLGGAAIA